MPKITLCAFADESGANVETQIDNLVANGIYNVELRSADGINVGDFTEEKAREVYRKFVAAGIKVWSLGSPLGKIDVTEPEEKHFTLLKNLVRTAKIVKTDKIRMFSYFMKRGEYDLYRGEVISRLKKMTDYAADNGITLCHENESEIFGSTVDNCALIADEVPGIKIVYDPANFIMWDENIDYALEKLFDKAFYFHIKDVIRESKTIVPAGYGDGQIDRMIKMLGRDATFTLEPHLHVFDGYGNIDKKQLKNKFSFDSQSQAFKASADAFKTVLKNNGYKEEDKGIWKK